MSSSVTLVAAGSFAARNWPGAGGNESRPGPDAGNTGPVGGLTADIPSGDFVPMSTGITAGAGAGGIGIAAGAGAWNVGAGSGSAGEAKLAGVIGRLIAVRAAGIE